jgi:hypothetical protein
MVSRATRSVDRTGCPTAGWGTLCAVGLSLWFALAGPAVAQSDPQSADWFGNPFPETVGSPGDGWANTHPESAPLSAPPASPYDGHSFLQSPPAEPVAPWNASPSPLQSESSVPFAFMQDWDLEVLPEGLLYKSYIAGPKEPRIGSAWLVEQDRGLIWEAVLGGREGIWRWGDAGSPYPVAAQLDVEGAALVRLDPEANTDVEAVDFRFGVLMTWRAGRWASKAGYSHVSSHLGDEFMIRNPAVPRYNYVRDSVITGVSFDASPDVRLYGEVAYAIGHQGGALPLELQFGAEYAPAKPSEIWGAPFAAVNSHAREDHGWINGVNVMAGWLWRGTASDHTMRVGMQYYSGPALQWSFVGKDERLIGGGLWLDY